MLTKIWYTISIILFCSVNGLAQTGSSQYMKIDSLVRTWNIQDEPGGAVGIMENGKTIFSRGFGMASLDYDIPNTENTLFNLGSISKQFTAMGIVRLSLEGKLSFGDDVRKYLPELPDFGYRITIRNLLHHTSGLRDIHSLFYVAGWRSEDPRSDADLLRILSNQKNLNFKPGDEYMYSNTGYILLARIIERVTGENFKVWMRNHIFLPLGLADTYVENNATRVAKGNATSYNQQNDDTFTRSVEYWNYTGSGNVHSTVGDMLSWLNNFISPTVSWDTSFALLQTLDTLNNGFVNSYAFGVEIRNYNGLKMIGHGGSVGGFRSYAACFPDAKISIVVLTNYSSSMPDSKVGTLADILMPPPKQDIVPQDISEQYTFVKNPNLGKYEADFWLDNDRVTRRVYAKNDTLWYSRPKGMVNPLGYIGNDEFIMLKTSNHLKIKFQFMDDTVKTMLVGSGQSQNRFIPYKPVQCTSQYLSQFAGTYNSPELNTYYLFFVKNDTLIGYHPRHGYFLMDVVKRDMFSCNGPFQAATYVRDADHRIIGMKVSLDRVKDLWLEKVDK